MERTKTNQSLSMSAEHQRAKASHKRLLEVIVTNAEEAIAAERGGADRLELIRNFEVGGLTPDIEVVRDVAKSVSIPIRVMVRERPTFDISDSTELKRIGHLVDRMWNLGVDGVVLGFIKDGSIDVETLAHIIKNIPEVKITFHRAFEATQDARRSISLLKQVAQIDRILTNSGPGSWNERIEKLLNFQELANPITILVGGDVDEKSLPTLSQTALREFHVGRAARTPETLDGRIDVSKLQAIVRTISDTLKVSDKDK